MGGGAATPSGAPLPWPCEGVVAGRKTLVLWAVRVGCSVFMGVSFCWWLFITDIIIHFQHKILWTAWEFFAYLKWYYMYMCTMCCSSTCLFYFVSATAFYVMLENPGKPRFPATVTTLPVPVHLFLLLFHNIPNVLSTFISFVLIVFSIGRDRRRVSLFFRQMGSKNIWPPSWIFSRHGCELDLFIDIKMTSSRQPFRMQQL